MKYNELFSNGSNTISLKAEKGNHFGNEILSLQCAVSQVLKFIEIDKSVQRDILSYHVANLQKYIQCGIDGDDIFFPPIILSARRVGEYKEGANEYKLNFEDRLMILDGQHRLKAFEIIIKRLQIRNDESSRKSLEYIRNFPLSLQIFLNLSIDEEKQLFTDINTKASKASRTIVTMYKNDDLGNTLVKDIIENHPTISPELFETRAKFTRKKLMTASALDNLNITLNIGLLHTEKIENRVNESNYNEFKDNTINFLKLYYKIFPLHSYREESIVYISKVIQSIGFFVGETLRKYPEIPMEVIFEEVVRKINWKHSNKQWEIIGLPYNNKTRKYSVSNSTRGMKIIVNYLNKILQESKVWKQ